MVNVVDATNLERNLYLTFELLEKEAHDFGFEYVG